MPSEVFDCTECQLTYTDSVGYNCSKLNPYGVRVPYIDGLNVAYLRNVNCVPQYLLAPNLNYYLWTTTNFLFILTILLCLYNLKVAAVAVRAYDKQLLSTNAVMATDYATRFRRSTNESHSLQSSVVQLILLVGSALRIWVFATDPWGEYLPPTYLHGALRAVFFRLPTVLALVVMFQVPLKFMVVLGTRKEKISFYSRIALCVSAVFLLGVTVLDVLRLRIYGHLLVSLACGVLLTIALVSSRRLVSRMYSAIATDVMEDTDATPTAKKPDQNKPRSPKTTMPRTENPCDMRRNSNLSMIKSIRKVIHQIAVLGFLGLSSVVSLGLLSVIDISNGVIPLYIDCFVSHYTEAFTYLYLGSVVFSIMP